MKCNLAILSALFVASLSFFVLLSGWGACDYVRYSDNEGNKLSMAGDDLQTVYNSDLRLTGLYLDNSSGGGIYNGFDFSVRGGDLSLRRGNYTKSNTTEEIEMNFAINNASVIDLSFKNNFSTFETFCLGSFSTEIKIGSARRINQTEEV